jgi:FADH2 O2-dependent halogenase
VDFNRNGVASGVTARVGESRLSLRSKLVIDASGRHGLLGRQLNLLRPDPDLQQFAVHTWFTGVDRGTRPRSEYTHVHSLPAHRGWIWQIPITSEITSIGAVVDREHFVKMGMDVAPYFDNVVRLHSGLSARMTAATPLREFQMDGNYSYQMDRFVGDGWMLVGDAAFFIDPIFSSGLSIALHSAKFAGAAILDALTAKNTSAALLASYETRLRAAAAIWREFVALFYEHSQTFGRVITSSPARIALIKLCEGEVYEDAAAAALGQLKHELRQSA